MEGVILESASFEFTQESNCVTGNSDGCEVLNIEYVADLGIDRSNGGFFVLKTEGWAIESVDDIRVLLERIERLMK